MQACQRFAMACRLGNFESRHLSPSHRVSDLDYHDVQNRRPSLGHKLLMFQLSVSSCQGLVTRIFTCTGKSELP